MAKAFCPIEKTLPVSAGAQSTQVSHMQALNLLQESQVHRFTGYPVNLIHRVKCLVLIFLIHILNVLNILLSLYNRFNVCQ